MENKTYESIKQILMSELIPALGCTEPGAIALAAYEAKELLGQKPEFLELWCSGNIVKNVKGVIIPNSGGLRGVDAAAILGVLADSQPMENKLEVLNSINDSQRLEASTLLKNGFCLCHLEEDAANLYIKAVASAGGHIAEVIIKDGHTNIVSKAFDGKTVFTVENEQRETPSDNLKGILSVKTILEFAGVLTIEDGELLFKRQIEDNWAIAEEGLSNPYGARVGHTIMKYHPCRSVRTEAIARSAAGSDARMNGCTMPVVINSGSGNQGITVTVPVVTFANDLQASEEKMYKALAVSNLISIHIKYHIGKLSAFCGAVSAACGSGAAIAYLHGADYNQICKTISNTLGNVGGIVCDGAKSSCAAKIASSLDAALLGYDMAKDNLSFLSGEGLIEEDIEETINNIGKMGRMGMKDTDKTILNLMLGNKDYICD